MPCKHSIMVAHDDYWADDANEMSGGGYVEESLYVNVATGVDRCKACGHLQYYTSSWRRFYEENIQVFGGDVKDFELIRGYRTAGAPLNDRDGRLPPVLTKIGIISGNGRYFHDLFTKLMEKGCEFIQQDPIVKVKRENESAVFFVVPSEDGEIITWTVYVPRTMPPDEVLKIRENVFDGILLN